MLNYTYIYCYAGSLMEPDIDARRGPLHTHPTSLSTSITIPPAAVVKPQGFLVRGFSPWGAAGVHIHLTLSHASYHRLTCPIVHRLSRAPAAYRHGCR